MRAPQLPQVAYDATHAGDAWRGEVIDVNSQHRLARTSTTYRNRADATAPISAAEQAVDLAIARARHEPLIAAPDYLPDPAPRASGLVTTLALVVLAVLALLVLALFALLWSLN